MTAQNPFSDQQALMRRRNVRTIFDVGSNVGNITDTYSQLFPNATIYCFEPFPPVFETLEKRFNMNPQVVCRREALSNRPADRILNVYSNRAANSFYTLSAYSLDSTRSPAKCIYMDSVRVQTNTLDSFCQERSIEYIDILKLDIQGAELDVLDGAFRMLSENRIGLIYSEVLFQKLYDGACDYVGIGAHLDRFGFSLYNFYNLSYGKDGFLRHGDGIFISEHLRTTSTDE